MVIDPRNRVGVLASGGGTTFEAARLAELSGKMKTHIAFVVCNNPVTKADVWHRAAKLGLSEHTFLVNNLNFPDPKEPQIGTITTAASTEILRLAQEVYDVEMLITLGFMKRLVPPVLGGILIANLHPGPLPATAGTFGEGSSIKAIQLGLTHAGPTFHFMSVELGNDGLAPYDEGQIIAHRPVKITAKHRHEYETTGRAELLFADIQTVEKAQIGKWIDLALTSRYSG